MPLSTIFQQKPEYPEKKVDLLTVTDKLVESITPLRKSIVYFRLCRTFNYSVRHIILIPSELVFALYPLLLCALSGEAKNTNFIVFGLTRSEFEATIYHTRGEHANHYTINAVFSVCFFCFLPNIL